MFRWRLHKMESIYLFITDFLETSAATVNLKSVPDIFPKFPISKKCVKKVHKNSI